MVEREMTWKVRVQNTFMNIPEELDSSDFVIHKSLSMETTQDNLNKWYIYNLPSFENRNDWNLLHNNGDKTDLKYLLKPTSMFSYSQDYDSKNINCNGCVPIDENGNLTSIGSPVLLINTGPKSVRMGFDANSVILITNRGVNPGENLGTEACRNF